MALEKAVIPISFAQGIDTKTDSKQVVPGKMLLLENCKFQTAKSFRKVPGDVPLSRDIVGSGAISNATALATFKSELILNDGSSLYSYAKDEKAWSNKGPTFTVSLNASPVVRNNYAQTTQDSATHSSGLQVFAWEDSQGGIRYSLIDSATNLQLVSNVLVSATGSVPQCYAQGNFLIIAYYESSGTQLVYRATFIGTPLTLAAPVQIASDINTTNTHFDGVVVSLRLFIAYNNDTGGISVVYLDSFLSQSATRTVAGQAASVAISTFADPATNVWVTYYNGTAVKAFVVSYSLPATPILAPTIVETVANVRNVTGTYLGASATIFYEVSAAITYNHFIRSNTLTLAGVAGTPGTIIRSVGLGSKAFTYGLNAFVIIAYESPLQPTYFLMNQNGIIAAKVSPLTGGGLTKKSTLPHVNPISSGIFQLSYLQQDFFATISGQTFFLTGVMQTMMNLNPGNIVSVEIGNGLQSSGGFLGMYDGVSEVELGYHVFPENVTITTSMGGGSIPNGTFQYLTVFAWTDNFGQIHRSAPSIGQTIVTTGSNTSTNTIHAPTLRITGKQAPLRSPVWIELYRTQANQTIFYLVSSITSPTYNSTTTDTVTFTDTLSDTAIQGNLQLYTTGGEIENIAPPAPKLIWQYKNRLILVPHEDPNTWWFSKEIIPGSPVEFTDSFVKNMDQRGGAITAGIQMDDKNIFFKGPSDIFYVVGDGPASTGLNDDFSQPQRVPTGAGCIHQKSVVLMPQGVIYQSMKGFYLLTRAIEALYIGAPVEAYNSANTTSGQLLLNDNEVRLTLDTGIMLLYDYFFNQWSTIPQVVAQDSAIFEKQFCYVNSNGIVSQEDPNIFTHNGNFRRMKLITSWLSLAQLQGFQRIYKMLVLGEYKSPHKLRINVAVNFNPTSVQEDLIDTTSLLANPAYGADSPYGSGSPYGGQDQTYQWRLHMAQQKCESMQFTIEEVPMLPYGEGLSLSAITLEVGGKKGAFKVAPSHSFG